MKLKVAVWIDRRQAIIVRFFDYGDDIVHVSSHLPKRVRFSGASYDKDDLNPHDDFAEDKRDRRFNQLLHTYIHEVSEKLVNADSILILGPGEAKIELQKRLENTADISAKITVEAADKMSEKQIVASARQYFQEQELKTKSAM